MANEILKDEIMTEEQLENVTGGATASIANSSFPTAMFKW